MSYTEPPADNTAYRMAALQALATGGTAAKAALDQAKAGLEASRAAASKDAMSAAAQYGLGAQAGQELAAPTDRAYNRNIAAVGTKVGAVTRGLEALATPLSNVLDTKFAAGLAARRGSGGGGGGGGGGGKEPKPVDPYKALTENWGGLENYTYQVKKDNPGVKFGDNRAAYNQAVRDGMPVQTATRLFDPEQGNAVYQDQLQSAQKRTPIATVKAHIVQQFGGKGGTTQNAATQYYTQQYRQLYAQNKKKK